MTIGEIINMQTGSTTIQGANEVLLNSSIRMYLTDEQLVAFRGFETYYQDLVTMLDAGVFTFKNGQAVIHRDHEGDLKRITFELVRYDKRHVGPKVAEDEIKI